jgi:hypothetical protein
MTFIFLVYVFFFITFLMLFLYIYSAEGFWVKPDIGGYLPAPRYLFSMDGNHSNDIGEIVVLGGKTLENSADKTIFILTEIGNNLKIKMFYIFLN